MITNFYSEEIINPIDQFPQEECVINIITQPASSQDLHSRLGNDFDIDDPYVEYLFSPKSHKPHKSKKKMHGKQKKKQKKKSKKSRKKRRRYKSVGGADNNQAQNMTNAQESLANLQNLIRPLLTRPQVRQGLAPRLIISMDWIRTHDDPAEVLTLRALKILYNSRNNIEGVIGPEGVEVNQGVNQIINDLIAAGVEDMWIDNLRIERGMNGGAPAEEDEEPNVRPANQTNMTLPQNRDRNEFINNQQQRVQDRLRQLANTQADAQPPVLPPNAKGGKRPGANPMPANPQPPPPVDLGGVELTPELTDWMLDAPDHAAQAAADEVAGQQQEQNQQENAMAEAPQRQRDPEDIMILLKDQIRAYEQIEGASLTFPPPEVKTAFNRITTYDLDEVSGEELRQALSNPQSQLYQDLSTIKNFLLVHYGEPGPPYIQALKRYSMQLI